MNQAQLDRIRTYEQSCTALALPYKGQKLRFVAINENTLMRVNSMWTKEPVTIDWLESFEPDSVMLDVGANVGMYSIFAAAAMRARVFSFEPESQNYGLLCRNIRLNHLGDRVTAYCCALSDSRKFSVINLSDFAAGASCHSFDHAVDFELRAATPVFVQGCFSTTVDELVADGAMPTPNYIKIDVDGFEHKVIAGAANTLRSPGVKSLIIEINPHLPEHRAIITHLAELGFHHDPAQAAKAARSIGKFTGVGEYVFRR